MMLGQSKTTVVGVLKAELVADESTQAIRSTSRLEVPIVKDSDLQVPTEVTPTYYDGSLTAAVSFLADETRQRDVRRE